MILLIPLTVSAADIFKIEPYITAEEVFSDNLYLTKTDRKSDFLTTLAPGIRLSNTGETAALNLNYNLGFNFFARESQNNYTSHMADLNGSYAANSRLGFTLRNYFVRSDDTAERQYLTGVQNSGTLLAANRGRSIFWRNVFEPGMEYRLGPESMLGLSFRDNIYRNEGPFIENSREDYISPRATYWFDVNHGATAEYGFLRGNFDRSADLDGHMARGRYMFRPETGKIFFGEYRFLRRNFDEPESDYDLHNPSIGTEYAFNPTFSVSFQLGYYWLKPEKGDSDGHPTGELSFLKRLIDTSVAVSARYGYYESYFSAENLGFARYYGLYGNVTHQWDQRTTLGANASMEWADFRLNRTDRIMTTGLKNTYAPLRWLTISFEAIHRENNGSDEFEYKENRIMARITAIYI